MNIDYMGEDEEGLQEDGAKKRTRYYSELIFQLKKDIEQLSDQINDENLKKKEYTQTSAKKIVQYLLHGPHGEAVLTSDPTPAPADPVALSDEEQKVRAINRMLTDFHIKSVSSDLIFISSLSAVRRRYAMQGSSYGVWCTLNFDVDEGIENLTVEVPEPVRLEIEPLIASVNTTLSVIHFTQSFSKYAEYRQHRFHIFNEIANNHPNHVSLPKGAYSSILVFEMSSKAKFGFQVKWDFEFSYERKVSQFIEIIPRFSEEVYAVVSSDTKKELKQLPRRFQQLVQAKGPKAAIEIFIEVGLKQNK